MDPGMLSALFKNDKAIEEISEYDIDLSNKIIYFHDDVHEASASDVIKKIKYMDSQVCKEDSDVITLNICSYGGSVDHMFAIYDAIQSSEHDIVTVGTGAMCSAAFLLLACGTRRRATQNSTAMIHKISGGAIGTEEEVEAQTVLMKKHQQLYYDILAVHTTLTAKEWRDMVDDKGEGWLDVNEMLKTGLIDEVVPSKVKPPKKRVRRPRKKTTTKK